MHVLIAGIGWLGREVARVLVSEGHRVTGVRRRVEGQSRLIELGVEPVVADLTDPRAHEHLPRDVEAVVACPAAGGSDLDSYRSAYVEVNRTLLAWARDRSIGAYVYTSSTGVFGYDDGREVDEETPVFAGAATAEVLVEAERLVLEGSGRVVRLSGLYGPDRFGIVDRVRRGALALGPGDATWMNFCHRADAAAFVRAALARGRDGAVYHGSDAEPARRREVVQWIASRLGIPPPVAPADTSRLPGGRRGADRRVLSEKTRAELGVSLRFPSFREGLEEAI